MNIEDFHRKRSMVSDPERGNNLFSVDLEAIERLLAEANQSLREKVARHLADAREMARRGADAPDMALMLRRTIALRKEVAQARLADGRSFSNASKAIKGWFAYMGEDDLARAEAFWRGRLEGVVNGDAPGAPPAEVDSVIEAWDGNDIVMGCQPADPPDLAGLQPYWQVADYDISKMDLNQLKGFLTDHGLRTALRKHLAACGHGKLTGVTYRQGLKP